STHRRWIELSVQGQVTLEHTRIAQRAAGTLLSRYYASSLQPSFAATSCPRCNRKRNLPCLHVSAAIHKREHPGVISGIQVAVPFNFHRVFLPGQKALQFTL